MIIITKDCEVGPDTGKFAFEVDCCDGDPDARRLLDLMTELLGKALTDPRNVMVVPGPADG